MTRKLHSFICDECGVATSISHGQAEWFFVLGKKRRLHMCSMDCYLKWSKQDEKRSGEFGRCDNGERAQD
jgi:hypothetical protein